MGWRMADGLAVLACASACGRFGFESENRSGDPDAAVGVDAAHDAALIDATDAPAAAPPCLGTAHLLTENFDDGVTNTALWAPYANAGTAHAETSGTLQITLGVNRPGNWAGYDSATTYDLRTDRLFVEVVTVPGPTGEVMLGASIANGDYVSLEYNIDQVIAAKTVGGTWTALASVAYNATQHRFWQLRERAGVLSWETSPDGVAWSVVHAQAPPFSLAVVTLVVGGGTEMSAPSSTIVRFDNINGGGAPPDCPL